jgi:GNAT superfamily N-acetyltransferase
LASADTLSAPRPLDPAHQVVGFDCGVASLNSYLIERALSDQRAGKSRSYVSPRGERVVAYFSLAAGSVEPAETTARASAGQGNQAIPVILLARLAVDLDEQGRGLGRALLLDALARSARAAEVIGARAVLVHATSERARGFYERHGFEPSPTDPLHLVVLMKDVRKALG